MQRTVLRISKLMKDTLVLFMQFVDIIAILCDFSTVLFISQYPLLCFQFGFFYFVPITTDYKMILFSENLSPYLCH